MESLTPEIVGIETLELEDDTHLVPAISNPAMLFSDEKNIERIIDFIHEKAKEGELDFDLTTKAGRARLKSQAFKVSRSKTLIVSAGKGLAADMRAQVKNIDSMCRMVTNRLDSLRDEIKAPAINYELAEEKRIDGIKARIDGINGLANIYDPVNGRMPTKTIKANLDIVNGIKIDDSFGEFKEEAQSAKDSVVETLTNAYEAALKDDEEEARRQAEREELERVRAELKAAKEREAKAKEEEERKAAIEKAAKEAAEKARAEAEAKAKEEAEAAERRAQKEIARAKAEAEAREEAIRAEAERIEREKAEAEKAAAEAKARREADRNHRKKINNDAASDLVLSVDGLTKDMAKSVVIAIASGNIRNVIINY
jgi:colicin import membrane protein